MTVVDSFTAQASLAPGLSVRPLEPKLTFDIHAMYLTNRPPNALAMDFLKTLARVLEPGSYHVRHASSWHPCPALGIGGAPSFRWGDGFSEWRRTRFAVPDQPNVDHALAAP
jgi:hypothetical protein